jgi:hypothetical protein
VFDSEHDDIEGRKTEYEREDPDYEPGSEKYKQTKKVSRLNVSISKPQDAAKHTAKNTDIESCNTLNPKKESDANRKTTKADILSSPNKYKEKSRPSTRIENGHENSKHYKYKTSFHQHKDSRISSKSKDHDEKHKIREKHRSSPHKKHGSLLLSPHNAKRDSELSFKLSNATKKDTSHISAFPSTKEAVNDSSSTEAIKKMLSGEKPMQLEKKSQQQVNISYHLSKEKSISHERKNANKLFPRNSRQSSADASETRKNQFQTTSPGLIHRSQNIEEQTKRTTNGIDREKYIQEQNSTSHNSTVNHNLLSCIMTEMEKKN